MAYTTGNIEGDDEFKRIAETVKAGIEKQKYFDPKKDKVVLQGVTNKDDLKNLVNSANGMEKDWGKVQSLVLVSHGGAADGPIFELGSSHQEQPKEFLSRLNVNWDRSSGPSAMFLACNSAVNFAQMFADNEQVKTFGSDGGTSISGSYPAKSKSYLFWDMFRQQPLFMVKQDGSGGPVRRDPKPPNDSKRNPKR